MLSNRAAVGQALVGCVGNPRSAVRSHSSPLLELQHSIPCLTLSVWELQWSFSLSFLGFPPIPGVTSADGDGTVAAMLESANRLVKMEEDDRAEEEEEVCGYCHLALTDTDLMLD